MFTQQFDSVIPRLLPSGLLLCPRCGNQCRTATVPNPNLGFREEPMVLVAGKHAKCPHEGCDAYHYFTEELARAFNRKLFPEDRRYWSPLET